MVNTSTQLPQCHLEAFTFNDNDRLAENGRTVDTGVYNVYGLCVYEYKGRQTVAMASSRMLLAIDLQTRQIKWRIDEKFDGRQVSSLSFAKTQTSLVYVDHPKVLKITDCQIAVKEASKSYVR